MEPLHPLKFIEATAFPPATIGFRVGEGCAAVMDATMRNLDCNLMQIDEIWGFVGKKQKNVGDAENRWLW